MLTGRIILKRTLMRFPISTRRNTGCGAPVYLYNFDKETPSRTKTEKTKDFERKNYFKLVSGSKGTVFARVYKNMRTASGGSQGLLSLAECVHRDSVLPDRETVVQYVADRNVDVFGRYVSVSTIHSKLNEYKMQGGKLQVPPHDIHEVLSSESNLIGEERQLTEILIEKLQKVLPSPFVVGNHGLLHLADIKKGVHFCEFATSQPDIVIKYSGARHPDKRAVAVNVNGDRGEDENDNVLGCTIEAKRDEFKVEQTIANVIKVATDLSIIAIKNGDYIQKVTVYGVAASYYMMKGKIVKLEMNFEKSSCNIQYVIEPFELSYCINAVCTMLK